MCLFFRYFVVWFRLLLFLLPFLLVLYHLALHSTSVTCQQYCFVAARSSLAREAILHGQSKQRTLRFPGDSGRGKARKWVSWKAALAINCLRNLWIGCLSNYPSLRKRLWPVPTSVITHKNILFISQNRTLHSPSAAVTCSPIILLEDTLPLPFPNHQILFQSLKP